MARYLVGDREGTWDFFQAYNHANKEDIIEFDPGFSLTFKEPFVFKKDLTLVGYKETKDGRNYFKNVLRGPIKIGIAQTVVFQNIWFDLINSTEVFSILEFGEIHFEDCCLANAAQETQAAFLKANIGAKVYMTNTTTEIPAQSDQTMDLNGANLYTTNCRLTCHIKSKNSEEIEITNTRIEAYGGNALSLIKSPLALVDSSISGGDPDQDFPPVWLENCQVEMTGGDISHYMCYCNGNTRIRVKQATLNQLMLQQSVAELEEVTLENCLAVNDSSLVYATGTIRILSKSLNKIPLWLGKKAAYIGSRLILEEDMQVMVRMKNQAYLLVDDIIASKCVLSDAQLEADDTCRLVILSRQGQGQSKREATRVAQAQEEQATSDHYQALQDLVGLASVKEKVDEMIALVDYNKKRQELGQPALKQVLHAVFMGNPGTGKTTVARLVGKILYDKGALTGDTFKFVEVGETDLLSGYVNQTAEQTKAKIEEARGGVLFIDEAYTLNKKGTNETGSEAINTLLKYMEEYRDELMVIFAGYTKEMEQFLQTNPGLKSRVPNTFDFEDYTGEQMVAMGLKGLSDNACQVADEAYYARKVALDYQNSLDKSNGRWMRNFNEKLMKALAFRVIKEGDGDISLIKNVDIDTVLSQGAYQDRGLKKDAWEELRGLVGLDKVKEQVEEFIAQAALNRKREEAGLSTSKATLHSLFLGNPGTGKTTVARILGQLLYQKGLIGSNKLVEVSRGDLVGAYQGHTAEKTREQLQAALGGVLFIDEAYALKQGANDSFGQEAIDEILKFMEDHRGDMVVIFAGYSKEMADFMASNSGLTSRVPNVFDFEDYQPEEIVAIGRTSLEGQGYQFDALAYEQAVLAAYARTNDHSNGRWVRNFNQKLLGTMSKRIAKTESEDYNSILQEDLDKMREI